jgi:hypothetical protein
MSINLIRLAADETFNPHINDRAIKPILSRIGALPHPTYPTSC